ncbi:protein NSP-INTERACTING KINASE 2 [Prunus yedoensis var. nudiflora]|uniref:Protein NSP-INTERACTING KINASE 2 n=1 Tax=Prunus yedoensis var. nudiflora TaxID=2094558 RepID=A0A314ZGN0_PRUYE|nr:protein NSP-INTERACTING KINASE 2 [Prunus yedoensis var. nudiflora]
MKASLDPQNQFLTSWTPHSEPCSGAFEGVACNEQGLVTNISLQGKVLQLCYNKLTGGLPTQLGDLKRLSVLAVQSNQLTGAIPASLGELGTLTRLDLSFNSFFGPIPARLAHAPKLQVLDVRSNSLSGNIPPALKRLNGGFQYENNPSLCGVGFSGLKVCTATNTRNPNKPQPFEPGNFSAKNLPDSPTAREIPESANLQSNCSQTHCSRASKSQKLV